jgi:hypothetical protein
MVMRWILILFLLAGCANSPSPQMLGATSVSIRLDGRDFTIWRKGKYFEIVRYGWLAKEDRLRVEETMLAAVERVTSCKVRVKSGDSAEIRGRLIACK